MIILDTHGLGKGLFLKRTSRKRAFTRVEKCSIGSCLSWIFYDGDLVQFDLTKLTRWFCPVQENK